MNVTIYRSFGDISTGFVRPVESVLARIKSGRSKAIVDQVRSKESKQEADVIKRTLPAILFSGSFRQRNDASIIEHSGLICLDFDKFKSLDDLSQFKKGIESDEYTFSSFISPSGNGLKVLVRIPPEKENHKLYFESLKHKYNSPYFDPSCSNVSRICFESYDPEIYINTNSTVWDIIAEPDIYDEPVHPIEIPVRSENIIVENLMKWFRRFPMVKGERNANLFKLAAAFNDYGVAKNVAEQQCMEFITMDFGSREIRSLVNSAYKKTASFGTKFFEDNYTKGKLSEMVRSGSTIKDIKRNIPELKEDEIEKAITGLNAAVSVSDFWQYSEKGIISILHHKFKYFLQERNYFKYYPSGTNAFIFIKINENLVEETNKDQIKDFTLSYLERNNEIGMKPFNYMAEKTKYFSYEYLSFLDTKEVKLLEDTPELCYLYFSNKIVQISKNAITEIDYIDSNGYVWKNQIINRSYIKSDFTNCVFSKFLLYVAGENQHRYNSLRSVIGYLLHSFKTSANNKAIILNDETISDTPNGGSGKGIFWNALSQMKKLNSLDGKSFSFHDQFKYQTISTDCQLLVFDDVKKNFDFESLFSLITEGIIIERKQQLAIKLPVSRSPKILITTNYTVGGSGGSFDRRKFEVEFSSYFNAQHTPLMVFGHLLFDEWSQIEWAKFDSFMIDCVQHYLTHGLVQHEFKNLEVRKFINKTSSEFYEYTNDEDHLPHATRIYNSVFMEDLMKEYPDLKKWLTAKRLKMWLDEYANYKGLTIKRDKDQLGRYFELFKFENAPF